MSSYDEYRVLEMCRVDELLPKEGILKGEDTFGFGRDETGEQTSVLKNGEVFFTSPIVSINGARLNVGIAAPFGVSPDWPFRHDHIMWAGGEPEVFIGGGGCCYGYLMGLTEDAKITRILAVDLNIHCIVPVFYHMTPDDPRFFSVENYGGIGAGLMVSGQGCAGSGVRFIDFTNVVLPDVKVVVGNREPVVFVRE